MSARLGTWLAVTFVLCNRSFVESAKNWIPETWIEQVTFRWHITITVERSSSWAIRGDLRKRRNSQVDWILLEGELLIIIYIACPCWIPITARPRTARPLFTSSLIDHDSILHLFILSSTVDTISPFLSASLCRAAVPAVVRRLLQLKGEALNNSEPWRFPTIAVVSLEIHYESFSLWNFKLIMTHLQSKWSFHTYPPSASAL